MCYFRAAGLIGPRFWECVLFVGFLAKWRGAVEAGEGGWKDCGRVNEAGYRVLEMGFLELDGDRNTLLCSCAANHRLCIFVLP